MSAEDEQYFLISDSAKENIGKDTTKILDELRSIESDRDVNIELFCEHILDAIDSARACDVIPRGLD